MREGLSAFQTFEVYTGGNDNDIPYPLQGFAKLSTDFLGTALFFSIGMIAKIVYILLLNVHRLDVALQHLTRTMMFLLYEEKLQDAVTRQSKNYILYIVSVMKLRNFQRQETIDESYELCNVMSLISTFALNGFYTTTRYTTITTSNFKYYNHCRHDRSQAMVWLGTCKGLIHAFAIFDHHHPPPDMIHTVSA